MSRRPYISPSLLRAINKVLRPSLATMFYDKVSEDSGLEVLKSQQRDDSEESSQSRITQAFGKIMSQNWFGYRKTQVVHSKSTNIGARRFERVRYVDGTTHYAWRPHLRQFETSMNCMEHSFIKDQQLLYPLVSHPLQITAKLKQFGALCRVKAVNQSCGIQLPWVLLESLEGQPTNSRLSVLSQGWTLADIVQNQVWLEYSYTEYLCSKHLYDKIVKRERKRFCLPYLSDTEVTEPTRRLPSKHQKEQELKDRVDGVYCTPVSVVPQYLIPESLETFLPWLTHDRARALILGHDLRMLAYRHGYVVVPSMDATKYTNAAGQTLYQVEIYSWSLRNSDYDCFEYVEDSLWLDCQTYKTLKTTLHLFGSSWPEELIYRIGIKYQTTIPTCYGVLSNETLQPLGQQTIDIPVQFCSEDDEDGKDEASITIRGFTDLSQVAQLRLVLEQDR